MRIKMLLGFSAMMLLAGCSSTNQLDAAGQQVKFTDDKPSSHCQLLGQVEGSQSTWWSGNRDDGSAMRGAANDLRNKAAAMGGNVIYAATSPSQNILSSLAPLDSTMAGQVYKCP